MRKARPNGIERLESYLVKLIQEKGADQDCTPGIRFLLAVLKALSCVFAAVVGIRYLLYRIGFLPRFPLGVQVISIGNVTAGGTGKTPVTEIFARTLASEGRKVAILSRGYRRKEAPFWQRMFTQVVTPPLVVSDGRHVLLDAATGGDEPYMLASNLPGVAVVVDRNRVKAGRYAIKRLGCDTLILDDGFQYQKLKHSVEVVLVDSTNPFGNGNMLPRGILREPARNLKLSIVSSFARHANVCESITDLEALEYLCAGENVYSTDGSVFTHANFANPGKPSGKHVNSAWNHLNFLNQSHTMVIVNGGLNGEYKFTSIKKGPEVTFKAGAVFEFIHNYGVDNQMFPGGVAEGVYVDEYLTGMRFADGTYYDLTTVDGLVAASQLVESYRKSWEDQLVDQLNLFFSFGFALRF